VEADPSTPPTFGSSLPIYVQVVQVILMPGASATESIADPPPNDAFIFDPVRHALAVRSPVSMAPQAQVVLGLTTVIREADQAQVHGQLFTVPPDDAGLVEFIAVEAGPSAVTLDYEGQTFVLAPEGSRSFRRSAGEATILTSVTNTGRLASIRTLPHERGAR
jgi:hypothetical protein